MDVTGDPPSILAFPKFMLMRYVGLSGVNHLKDKSTGTQSRDDMREGNQDQAWMRTRVAARLRDPWTDLHLAYDASKKGKPSATPK
jgi:hypothetical protein